MDIPDVLKQIEDHLFPVLKMTVRERSLYYYFFRHTHLIGKHTGLFAIAPVSNELDIAESSVRESIRAMHDKGCIRFDRSRQGHAVRVMLPAEINGIIPEEECTESVDIESIDFFTGRAYVIALIERENGMCFYCLRNICDKNCELDHVAPQMETRDNSYRNVVASCHECNTTKQGHDGESFLRSLYRNGVLSQTELQDRLSALDDLRAGRLMPDI